MLIGQYIGYVSDIRRYSLRTRTLYKEILEDFAKFVNEGGEGCPSDEKILSSLTPNLIRAYEVYLLDQGGDNARTVNLHLSVLSGFCRFLMKNRQLAYNPIKMIRRPKEEKRLPVFYREESMKEYFESTDCYAGEDTGVAASYKKRLARLIVSILYDTGMRRSELIGLRIGSVDFGRRIAIVSGKGDKMREIPLVPSLCKEISLYLQATESKMGSARSLSDPLLVTEKGSRLYPVYVDRVIKSELGRIPSITGRKSPHVLRHTLATELLNNGADLNSIKELLGHSSLAATQVYTHNSIEKLKKVYNNAHPRAKSGGHNGD